MDESTHRARRASDDQLVGEEGDYGRLFLGASETCSPTSAEGEAGRHEEMYDMRQEWATRVRKV